MKKLVLITVLVLLLLGCSSRASYDEKICRAECRKCEMVILTCTNLGKDKKIIILDAEPIRKIIKK